MRSRSWRRSQNERIIQKRLRILKNTWRLTGSRFVPREIKKPGLLRKWNFTCGCESCKMDRQDFAVRQRKEDKDHEKVLRNSYSDPFYL